MNPEIITDVLNQLINERDALRRQNKSYREAIDKIMECVNEHLSNGSEINPYKIEDIVDVLEDDSE